MLLQPRTFRFKKKQKSRSFISFNNSYLFKTLRFGGAGLRILKPVQITSKQLFKFKLFLKRASRRSEKTRRFVWFLAFPHLPLTRKPEGVRMGKGKGKGQCWQTNVSGGTVLIEFKNLRSGRASFFMKQMTHKLGIPTKFLYATSIFFNNPIKQSLKTPFRLFW